MNRVMARRQVLLAAGAGMLAAAMPRAGHAKEPSATLTIDETQVAFIFSGQIGGGKLHYRGQTHDFNIGGLGIGGIGVSTIRAVGEVYDLRDIDDFYGVYGQVRTGYAIGWQGDGHLWLQNPQDVVLHLRTAREGLMLTLGADGVVISRN